MEHSETLGALGAALAEAQGKFPLVPKEKSAVIKTKTGGEYGYKYADLADVTEIVKPILPEHGLSVIQTVGYDLVQENPTLTTMLLHSSGEWLSDVMVLTVADKTPQVLGSYITYARRYAKCAILGLVADEDTDGDFAQAAGQESGSSRRRPPASSTSTRGTRSGGAKDPAAEGRTEFDARSRNKVIAHLGRMDPPVRGDEAVAAKVAEVLGLDDPLPIAKVDIDQGAKLVRELGVEL
jgi:hypothetical protein